MIQFILFIVIYTILMFFWSDVFINRTSDNKKLNYSFLYFLSSILLWMFFDIGNLYAENMYLELVLKSVYFITMLNMSVLFLNFIYYLIKRKHDILFWSIFAINTLTIVARYLFPIDYTVDNFWQMTDPIIAPLMSTLFSLPIIFALYLIIKYYIIKKETKIREQLKFVIIGIASASIISIISEYILPSLLNIQTDISLMYIAILMLVLFLFFAIIRHKFLNVQAEYIYKRLFVNSNEGIVLVNKDMTILSINEAAKKILKDNEIGVQTKIDKYITKYDFNNNYNQYETTISVNDQISFLALSQSPIETSEEGEAKLLHIIDITESKKKQNAERDDLTEKSSIDQLTGLYNKRYIENNYANKPISSDKSNTVLFIDIDDFKYINDTYGHSIGDEVLKGVASCIKNSMRENEKTIRYGGDEFIVILESTDVKNAFMISERIRKQVNILDFKEYGCEKNITLSIGISSGNEDIYEVIKRADTAMYESKNHGKNKTSIFQTNKFI